MVRFAPNFQRFRTVKLYVGCENVLRCKMIRTSSITMPRMVGLGLHPPLGGGKFDVCFFCLTARFLNGTICERDFAVKLFELRISFDTVG